MALTPRDAPGGADGHRGRAAADVSADGGALFTGLAPPHADDVEDVLVLRALGLGDALTAVPALRGVRRAWPHARVTVVGPEAVGAWLREAGVCDRVLPADGIAAPPAVPWVGGGHVAVNLHGRGPESTRRLLATQPRHMVTFADALVPTGPAWRSDEHEVLRWMRLVHAAGGTCSLDDLRLPAPEGHAARVSHARGEVVLHPGAASAARRWPVERWTELARHLARAGYLVDVTGSAAERDVCAAVVAGLRAPGDLLRVRDLAGTLTLPALVQAVASARLVVCGDTGVAHVATAVGVPSVLLFGPVAPDRWGPLLDVDRHTVLWHGDGTGDPHGSSVDPALDRIGVGEVLAAALAQLDRGRVALTPAPAAPTGTTPRSAPGRPSTAPAAPTRGVRARG
ncbi:glycosyltransferase family 9 protein [Cellulomonas fimi]|uniref:glycosyltransferase family 9 protein n=1 Tax=Cellulomonas fimi TaxID=1708 RepID=UPI00234E1A3D|nr:glycosyltransferase family 9 protein [Cellulomonas fimi]MDC7122749.1 glycosyltransferase family 9 protein [Cellulomonas fimi]